MSSKAQITYPAQPPAPGPPSIGQVASGSLGSRTEYYRLTYVTPEGESLPGPEANIAVAVNSVAQVAPPAYPYPFAIYGYNVYGASASGAEVLQNGSMPVLAGQPWTEPATGMVTGSADPPTGWAATLFTFGFTTWPKNVPFDQRSPVRHKNVAASGIAEIIYEHTDRFLDINLPYVSVGGDVEGWQTFVEYAEQGGIFTFLPNDTIGAAAAGNYTLWDDAWDAAYKQPGQYSFKMKWRRSLGPSGSGGTISGGGTSMTFVGNETPLDSGDHQHFTLANTPNPSASVELILKGTNYPRQPLFQTGSPPDFTVSANQIALGSAIAPLAPPFTLAASYWY